jgi:ABC-2 type transport system permease protein
MFDLFLYEMRKRRNAIIGWGVGMAIYVAYILILYPSIGDAYGDIISNLGDNPLFQMFGDFANMTTFSGFFSLYVADYLPLILAIYAIINGTGTLAGEEEAGTLELSQPLARWQIVIVKTMAMMLAMLLILLATLLVTVITFVTMEEQIGPTDVTIGDLAVLILYAWPVVIIFMLLGLFLGAFLPNRRLAAMVVTVFLIISFIGDNLASVSDTLEVFRPLFPFTYYNGNEIFAEGVPLGDLLALLGANAVLLLLAVVSFQRRNITVGAWPWQRARIS